MCREGRSFIMPLRFFMPRGSRAWQAWCPKADLLGGGEGDVAQVMGFAPVGGSGERIGSCCLGVPHCKAPQITKHVAGQVMLHLCLQHEMSAFPTAGNSAICTRQYGAMLMDNIWKSPTVHARKRASHSEQPCSRIGQDLMVQSYMVMMALLGF